MQTPSKLPLIVFLILAAKTRKAVLAKPVLFPFMTTVQRSSQRFERYLFFTRMKNERVWLVTIHCAHHRLGLALKDVLKRLAHFSQIDAFYQSIWSYSGKLKAEIKKACEALNITYYAL